MAMARSGAPKLLAFAQVPGARPADAPKTEGRRSTDDTAEARAESLMLEITLAVPARRLMRRRYFHRHPLPRHHRNFRPRRRCKTFRQSSRHHRRHRRLNHE